MDTDVIIYLLAEECVALESNQLFLNNTELTYAFVQTVPEQRFHFFRMPGEKNTFDAIKTLMQSSVAGWIGG